MMGLLSVTDETSAAVLGLCLGIAWLVDRELLAVTRRQGVWLFARAAGRVRGHEPAVRRSLAPGGPVQKMSFVAPRSPGVQQPPLPLSTGAGLVALIADTLPVWTILLALVLVARRRGAEQDGPRRGTLVFAAALAVVSIVGLTTVDVNGGPPEASPLSDGGAVPVPARRRALPRPLVAARNGRPHAGAGGAGAGRRLDGALAQSLLQASDAGIRTFASAARTCTPRTAGPSRARPSDSGPR